MPFPIPTSSRHLLGLIVSFFTMTPEWKSVNHFYDSSPTLLPQCTTTQPLYFRSAKWDKCNSWQVVFTNVVCLCHQEVKFGHLTFNGKKMGGDAQWVGQ